jgi:cephalosporin-C deacetylase-like acetyl esterase
MFRILSFLLIPSVSSLFAQTLAVQTAPAFDQSNNIRLYLSRVAGEISDDALVGINTLEDWQECRQQRLAEFTEMMGLYDVPLNGMRPPLNVKIVGTLQKEGYRIEKLFYESLPDLYVPANLYIPEGFSEPRPAILYVCGHARTQKAYYQAHARQFAKLGFVCLIIETIQWGEVQGEHWGCYANGWFHWYSRGYTPGGVELWNAIRGLDLLCERKEVDPEKLGVTGISGGGAQTWYLAAADPRIKAAAPVCGASTLKAHVHTRTIDGHCDCMVPINTYQRDFHDIGALIAPRPLLIAQADRDGLNTIESVRELYKAINRVYDLYGAGENLSLVETPGGHSYHKISRQKIFSFFIRHLMQKDVPYASIEDIDESDSSQVSKDALRVYLDGPLKEDRTKTIQDSFIRLPRSPQLSNKAEFNAYKDKVTRFLKTRTFGAFPDTAPPFDVRNEFRTNDDAPYGQTVYSFVSEKDWRLKIDIRWRNRQNDKNPIMIVLKGPGEKRFESEELISGLDSSWNIAFFEARGIGENGWAPELQWHIRRASAWTGRTVASMRVYDVLRCIRFLKTLNGVNGEKIGVAAQGEMAAIALYAALLDGNCNALILKTPPSTQNAPGNPDGRGEALEMLNCLRIININEIPALLFPATIAFIGDIPESYKWSQQVYSKLGMKSSFRVIQKGASPYSL